MLRFIPWAIVALLAFGLGWWAASINTPIGAEPARHAGPPAFPMSARLGANIWQQASAEYAACCLTIYNAAAQRLRERITTGPVPVLKPAVVMDLDETVLDNGAFQTFLYRNNLEYTDELWLEYEEKHASDVRLVPGAAEYIAAAQRLGVEVVFVSNRSERFRAGTEEALKRLLPDRDPSKVERQPGLTPVLYLKTTSSEKATRREEIAARFTVLQVFGDNLRDFSECFAVLQAPHDLPQAILDRKQRAAEAAHRWGVDWFMLPNAVYGEWDKLIGPDPLAVLHPTSMRR